MEWFINYQKNESLSASDRGFSYGDGIFETLFVHNGVIQFESSHINRLLRGIDRLKMSFSIQEVEQLFCFIKNKIDINQTYQGVKIIVSRGIGGRGYLPPQKTDLTIAVGFFSYEYNERLNETGVTIARSPICTSINRSLAGLKHLNRLENVLAKDTLSLSAFEAIMEDDDGFLVECIQSNIFWFKNGMLHTPLLNRSGVQGTIRSAIINNFHLIDVCVGQYTINDLLQADEVFICNSLMGIIPVIELKEGRLYQIGERTRKIQKQFNISI